MIKKAKREFGTTDCIAKLERKLHENKCHDIDVVQRQQEVLIRCKKSDDQRKNFWDSWWFRITSIGLKIHPEQLLQIKEHTICTDVRFRIEAYPE